MHKVWSVLQVACSSTEAVNDQKIATGTFKRNGNAKGGPQENLAETTSVTKWYLPHPSYDRLSCGK